MNNNTVVNTSMFYADCAGALGDDINRWIEEYYPGEIERIIDIKYQTCCSAHGSLHYSAMVIYERKLQLR